MREKRHPWNPNAWRRESSTIPLTIGQISVITRPSVKTLRSYHEIRILVPARVDPVPGYRYEDDVNVERARIIVTLRHLDRRKRPESHRCGRGGREDPPGMIFRGNLARYRTEVQLAVE